MASEAGPDTSQMPGGGDGRVARPVEPAGPRGVWKRLPGLYVLRHYRRSWLRSDLTAGLALAAVLAPVGMGYAQAAGLPAIYGLYATIVPLIAYAVFGPSRILVLGPDSSLAPMIAATILPLAGDDPARLTALAGMLAILTGALCILAGLARLGFLTELLSKPIRYGYMNGIALTVLLGQLPRLFGFSTDADNVPEQVLAFAQGVLLGRTNWTSLALGGASLGFLLLTRRSRRFPAVLAAVAGATLANAALDLTRRAGVQALGALPRGLPTWSAPLIYLDDLAPLLLGAIAIAMVAFADTSLLSRSLAARRGAYVDPNQEMIALGAANLATGFFQGFPVSSSASRTPVAEAAGSKTQLTGVIGAIAVALLLVYAPGLLKDLPIAALAAVVIASALRLFEIRDLRRIYRIQRWEFWLSVACFLGVLILGPIPGIIIAIIIALLEFVWDGWRPHYAVLGRADGVKGYHDITRYPQARLIPGLVLFRWDAPLFFANAELFHDQVRQAIDAAPTPTRWFVVASEPITSVDVTAADMLAELDEELRRAGVELVFAEMKDPVKDKFRRFGLTERFDAGHFFATLGQAVSAYLKASGVEWEDWEARA